MPEAGLKELLEAGVDFGHRTSRWNPNMRRYIAGQLHRIHIIDLNQTAECSRTRESSSGSPPMAAWCCSSAPRSRPRDIQDGAERWNMPYVARRWLAGTLTNFNTSRPAWSGSRS